MNSRDARSGHGNAPCGLTVLPIMNNAQTGAALKVAMVAYPFPPLPAGGARHALELAKALGVHGVESFFIVANLRNSPRCETYEGFPVYRFTPRGFSRIRYVTFALQVCKKLWAERNSIGVIHLHSIRPFYFFILALAKVLKKPIVLGPTLMGHDDPMSLKKKPFLWQVEGKLYRYYDKIICKSTTVKESCVKAGIPEAKLVSIPGAVPCAAADSPFRPPLSAQEIQDTRKSLGLPLDSFIATFVGNIQERKGSDLLFDAWEGLAQGRRLPGHLMLVGPYPTGADEFGARVKPVLEKARESRIIFTGQVDYAEVPKYLRASDCFVFPSKREGLSKAVIEAMACGLPVICTNIPGVTDDMIDDGEDGIIVADRDPAELAKAILRVKEDEALRKKLSANAIDKVRRKFSLADVTRRHLQLYNELLENRP
jgi:glycosyltransferase involved in cell wall biosynthesis